MTKFPQHEHPEGSSEQILPDISNRYSAGGRKQEFTVGSRNAEPDGIAAKASKLEAGALNMRPRKKNRKK